MTDTELLAALRTDRMESAFVQLYRQLPDVIAMVRTHGGTKTEARDLFQDALVILHEKVAEPAFQLTGSINAYLYGVCRNLWLAELRAKGRTEKAIALATEPSDETEFDLKKESALQLAERAFAALGAKCRELLTRFYLHHEPLNAIAHAFGYASEGAAKTRKYKCLEQAREKYRALMSNTQTA